MDIHMKKLSKPRMEEYERRRRREREKYERQQGIQIDDRETSLFSEPRRANPSEEDTGITAALGEFVTARDFINQNTVGISRQAPGSIINNTGNSRMPKVGSTVPSAPLAPSQQQQQQHHYQPRPPTFLKQADNKPPYNGRGGYPGQPMQNDIPSSSGMAPPRGPPRPGSSNNNTSSATNNLSAAKTTVTTPLGPPISTQIPNGRLLTEKAFQGPTTLHNGGRFVQPTTGKPQPAPKEKDVSKIIKEMTNNFAVTPLTSIAATPLAPVRENYNLNGPNKFKYAFDTMVDPIGPLGSPPLSGISASASLLPPPHPLVTPKPPITSPIPRLNTPPQASILPTTKASPTPATATALKPLKIDKSGSNHTLEKQDSCLENDLELSESDDDRKKDGRSVCNSSNSSESDSSESGSEESTKGEPLQKQLQQQQQLQPLQQRQQVNAVAAPTTTAVISTASGNASKKKYSQTIIASGGNTISGLLTSSGLGGSGGNASGGGGGGGSGSSGIGMSSSSSSNKTPSPTECNKWTLSRFFNKPANQPANESVSPGSSCSQHVSMKVPGILPGGAQIIPESIDVTTAIVKNEKLHDGDEDEDEEDDEDNNESGNGTQAMSGLRYGSGLSVTPVGITPFNIKKEALEQKQQALVSLTAPVQQMTAQDCVAIPKNQIKRESSALLEDQRRADGLLRQSDANSTSSSDSACDVAGAQVLPMLGPDGTLQIPGVPADITAVSVPKLAGRNLNSQPVHRSPVNSVTLTPIGPLPASPKARQKKPRKKKMSAATVHSMDSSDDDEPTAAKQKVYRDDALEMSGATTTVVASTLPTTTITAAPKKGRGRPRKQHPQQVTPTTTAGAPHRTPQSGNLSSTSTSSQAKGPTLTAKKLVTKTTTARKRANSSNSSTSTTPTKKLNNNVVLTSTIKQPASYAKSPSSSSSNDEDSSSSSSSSYSKSSSSSSETETDKRSEQAVNRRVVNINMRAAQPKRFPDSVSSSSSSSSSDEEAEDDDEDENDGNEALPQATAAELTCGRANTQHQSPFKTAAPALASSSHSRLSTSESSSASSSSEDDHRSSIEKKRKSDVEKRRKTDKNKINTLTRIFNPKEGGAKKQGQVVIMDQSEELQVKEPSSTSMNASSLGTSLTQVIPKTSNQSTVHSPRLTPGGQRLKTPTRTPPTRTPTPTTQQLLQQVSAASLLSTASPARTTTPHLTSLICKIDLSKLARVPAEWNQNSYRLHEKSAGGTRISTPAYDHETILNADLQASTQAAHMRLKAQSERERERERSRSGDNIHELQNGHLSSRSADGACTPKEFTTYPAHLTPNGYAPVTTTAKRSPACQKTLGNVKPEHSVKYEPELDAGYETKYKPSVKQEFMLKQEQLAATNDSPNSASGDSKPVRRRKRSSSSSSSPYKEKKRKKEKMSDLIVPAAPKELPLLPTNHERLSLDKIPNAVPKLLALSPLPPPPATCSEAVQTTPPQQLPVTQCSVAPVLTRVIYRSYFDREDEPLNDDIKNNHFLQEAIKRKHAADSERDSFNQVTLYLEAVVYFLLAGAVMERCSTESVVWTMYKDTLMLIKFISSKFRTYQQSTNVQHETHNKVAILSLRCQSLISLKLYKLRRSNCRAVIASCNEFFRSGRGDMVNGNTPSSISPSNSVGSQGSGSNTPPGKIVPQDIHNQLCKQNEYFTYVNSAHDLWDLADRLVRTGNHTDFFRELDHENGPLTLHSTMHEVFRYVQAGLKTLRAAVLHPHSQQLQGQ
ncbi:AF4/FMR2 family member 4 [Scaptodrosophila lebanonensis]|uniref:AF4/FMR2 family member lilli n=1 Tax=Drosophila lebanonensis TaxID=7225 RepID=A0A6J2TRA0_DROLE|nr:AF4/FMR2 family member 4 [Scaptodrosophila lebanonensis]XP_030377638.1 AF4/FMR2 family member 4 [Scaptodrosophila lebanonensis]